MERIRDFLRDTAGVLKGLENEEILEDFKKAVRDSENTMMANEREQRNWKEGRGGKRFIRKDLDRHVCLSFIWNKVELRFPSGNLACFWVLQPKGISSHQPDFYLKKRLWE